MSCIQDVEFKQLQETLVCAQEALVIQILLDVLHQYKQVDHHYIIILCIAFHFIVIVFTSLSRITRSYMFICSSNVYYKSSSC